MVGGGGRVGISEFTSSSLGTYPLGRPLKDDINMEIRYKKADYKYVHGIIMLQKRCKPEI